MLKQVNFRIICIFLFIASNISSSNILNKNDITVSPDVSHLDVTETLEFLIQNVIDNHHESKAIDYEALRNSSSFNKNLSFIRRGLKTINVKNMKESERKSFFINVYNILVLDSILRLPKIPESLNSVPDFEYKNKYRIGNKDYHLASIKHGILRENSPDPKTEEIYLKDENVKYFAVKKDQRVLFSLYKASQSGPPLQSITKDSMEDQLNAITRIMCNEGVKMKDDSNIIIDSFFEVYMKDFASSAENLLRWLSKCVEDTDKKISLYFAAIDNNLLNYAFEKFDNKIPILVKDSKQKKLELDIYIESLCPDTHNFFEEQLLPSYEEIKKIVNLNIVTFGKATVIPLNNGEELEFECQNGPLECVGNKIMSCVVEYFPVDIQVSFITCLMISPSMTKAIKECGRKNNVPVAAIQECSTSTEGSSILYENGLKTLELKPELYFIPTVTVNKQYNSSTIQMSVKHFSNFICKTYLDAFEEEQGIFTPSGCRVKIDVYLDSLNPEVHRFFSEQLIPTWLRVGESIDLSLIPYGTTNIMDGDSTEKISSRMKCSRGPLECYGNIVMSCVVDLLPVETQIRVLNCMMKKKVPSLKGKECSEQEGVDWNPIDKCAEGDRGSRLLLENKKRTEMLSPKIASIPTITVNKIQNSTFTEWALHDLTALVCDAFLVANENEGRITLPRGCPVRIEMYLEMLCPDTKRFFLKVFYPAWKQLRALIDLHLIPFGKANVWMSNNGKDYEFECQHGPMECKGNKVLSCIVEYLPTDLQVDLIACMLQTKSPSEAGEQCSRELKIHWEPLKECYTSTEGSKLLFQNGVRTMKLKPAFYFVPTVTINKYFDSGQLQMSLNHLDEQVCTAYQKPFKRENKILTPKGCKLETEIYFVGFSEDSKTFFLNQLVPVWKRLGKVLDLKLYPIGRVSEKSTNKIDFEESCRKDEDCAADLITGCVIKHFAIEDQLNFIECSVRANNSITASKKCSQIHNLSWDRISKCFRSSESVKQLEKNLQQTKLMRPTFHSVPTVLINGYYDKQELQKSRFQFQHMICDSFYDPASLDKWKPEGCPVTLEVFMASLCPDTKMFFLHQVRPTWKALNSILDLKIIPFGKASAKILNPDKEEYEFTCQHGPLECYGNKVMSCVVKHYSVDDQVNMLSCMLVKEYPAIEGRECADELDLNWDPIIDCIDTKGSFLLYQNGLKTQNVKPSIFSIPSATVNGLYNKLIWRKSLRNLSGVVCSTYLRKMDSDIKLPEIPNGCKVTVKIFFYSLDSDMKLFFSSEAEEFWRIFKRIVQIKLTPLKHLQDQEINEDCSQNNCYRTKILACLVQGQETQVQMEFVACLMDHEYEDKDLQICSESLNLEFEELHSCALSPKSSKILEDNQENFLKLQNESKIFPLILIGKTILQNQKDLRKVTCTNFPGPAPPECPAGPK